jgi:hypothetical protein
MVKTLEDNATYFSSSYMSVKKKTFSILPCQQLILLLPISTSIDPGFYELSFGIKFITYSI